MAWPEGHVVVPLLDPALLGADRRSTEDEGSGPGEPTGAGDSFVAGLATALLAGADPATAAWRAAAAALTAERLGGRPALSLDQVFELADRARATSRS